MGASIERQERYLAAERTLWRQYGLEPRERFIEAGLDRTRLRVTEAGSGDPIVFIGGTGGTGPYWAPLVAELEGRAVIVDRPGFGLSDPVDYKRRSYTETVSAVLLDVFENLDIDQAAVVGASIGDVWAMIAAEQLGDRVRCVVLLGGGPITAEITPPPFIRLLRSPVGALIVRVPQSSKMIRSQLRQLGHEASLATGKIPDAFVEWHLALGRSTRSMHHERAMVQAVLGPSGFVPDLLFDDDRRALVKQPVLMVVGSADPVGSTEIWENFTDSLPDATLRIVQNGGHLPWWDDPAQVAAWMADRMRAS